jgi:molecular chaperone GrpE
VSNKKTFSDRLTTLLFGPPIPVLSERDLDALHQLDGKLDDLLALLNSRPQAAAPMAAPPPTGGQAGEPPPVMELSEQVRKLAKTQFKANALQETHMAQQQETIAALQKSLEQQEKQQAERQQQAIEQAQLEMLTSLLPVIDSLDAAFETGRRMALKLPMPAETRRAVVAWLDGIRLARLRLLDLLKNYNVTPIPTVGHPFDPNRHVAVATDTTGRAADGLIVSEDRRGYAAANKVLRYAEVVVSRLGERQRG